jgi:hypothetical protein
MQDNPSSEFLHLENFHFTVPYVSYHISACFRILFHLVTVLFRPYSLFITNGAFAHPAYFSVLDPGVLDVGVVFGLAA